jgi:lipopolysaccharide heptosyltransferase II
MSSPSYSNILCIRPDNMGDIIMSGPAIRALKQSFGARITLLASPMGRPVTPLVPAIDETIVAGLPWTPAKAGPSELSGLVNLLQSKKFDLAVIFTVYSQSPLPAALLCWQAGIPARAAWCRENPYALLTHWLPDPEPYQTIRHQVERDLLLVRHLGADTADRRLSLKQDPDATRTLDARLKTLSLDRSKDYIVLHPGVSEQRREYPLEGWIELARKLHAQTQLPLLVTGGAAEREKTEQLVAEAGKGIHSLAGVLTLAESVALISHGRLLITVNTIASHIAAAVGTPVFVLYAMTNPQHTPWQADGKVFPFGVDRSSWSRNEVIRYVCEQKKADSLPNPTPEEIVDAAVKLLNPTKLTTHPAHPPAIHRAGTTSGGSAAGPAPAP